MAITTEQVRVYMSNREAGLSQETAAAKAGISERTGRRVETRGGGKVKAPRKWRTRQDPFALVWASELVPKLEAHPSLQAITLLEWLQTRYPGAYPDKHLRTLQRQVKLWRVMHGPGKEVMFRQRHAPGRQGLSDFTELKGVLITIRGEPLSHRLYHFRLAYSGWSDMKVTLGGESYTALAAGVKRALEHLGGVPLEHRTDSLSAAFKNLSKDEAKDLTERYNALCAHYGMKATRNNPGRGHENGSVESPHGHLKRRIEQALLLRGSNDFEAIEAYQAFIDDVVTGSNRRHRQQIAKEHPYLNALPHSQVVDYTEQFVRVTSSSTLTVRLVVYSVPSRLIGGRFRVHLYDDRLVLYQGLTEILRLTRVYPPKGKRRARCIDYRHLIDWLVRKPMAFRGLQFRDDLLPGPTYRTIWAFLEKQRPPRQACQWMVGGLKLAADHDCEAALGAYWLAALEHGDGPTLVQLQARFGHTPHPVPVQTFQQHALAGYDALLPQQAARAVEAVPHG